MSDSLLITSHGRVREICLNRPEKKNALTLAMYQGLSKALKEADQDPEIRVILLTGAGDSFSSGNDIGDFIASLNQPDAVQGPLGFLQAISTTRKPVVAAVPGIAVGIGTTMLLHCDLVLASDQARFQLPFARLGLVPEGGASYLLPQLAGHRKAFEMLVLGEPFGSDIAQQIGLVNRVVAHEQLFDEADKLALELAAMAPDAVQKSKQMLRASGQEQLQQVLVAEVEQFAKRLTSAEAMEALKAFMEKRVPDFSRF